MPSLEDCQRCDLNLPASRDDGKFDHGRTPARWRNRHQAVADKKTMKRPRRHPPSILAAVVVAGLSSLAADGARAELRPVFDELKLYNSPATLPTIEVEAEGQDWTRVSTETLHVTTNYYVSLRSGDIVTISGIFD